MFIKQYFIALFAFLAIDMFWLGIVAKNFYSQQIGFLMKKDINWLAAITFYLLFVGALVFFVISPSVERKSWLFALFAGAFFGLITYATYDLTNLATLKDWPLLLVIVDLIWGMLLSASVSIISYFVVVKLKL